MQISQIEGWKDQQVFVLGDIMLDKFVYGHVDRVSPEAPVPVLLFRGETVMLGGAANVARNIVALGAQAVLAGVVGEDAAADQLAAELAGAERIESRLVRSARGTTTVKTRFVTGAQQIMRLDVEQPLVMDDELADRVVAHFEEVAGGLSAVVLSDYAKGTLSHALVGRIIARARAYGLPVVVDPKTTDVARYAGATVLTPNALETAQIAGIRCDSDEHAEAAARAIAEKAGVEAVVVTRGPDGMTVLAPGRGADQALHIPTRAAQVFDVSGAGDTVVATLALGLGGGADVAQAAGVANAAAGISVGKRGTSVVLPGELRRAISGISASHHKIVDRSEAAEVVADWKKGGLKVGFTNGCFDLIHPGHVQLLRQSREACDRLVVALNTDASVSRLKGPTRPVQSEMSRAQVMASIESADLVVLFGEDTPLELIAALKPDVLVKGNDYTIETVVGADVVMGYGGTVALVPLEAGHSTTAIIARANS